MRHWNSTDGLFFLALLLAGCGQDGALSQFAEGGSTNVTQGGTRDIGRFRKILAEGNVPSPDAFDDVGFFAEHAIDLPPAQCGTDVCLHPMLAVAPTFSGKNWTAAFVAMNSAVDPKDRERPRAHIVLAVEAGPATEGFRSAIARGASAISRSLQPGDRVSLVSFRRRTYVLASTVAPESHALWAAFGQLSQSYQWESGYDDGVALYDGLATAGRLATEIADFEGVSRIVLITTGNAKHGVTDPARILALAEGLAERGVAISVVGIGDASNRLPSQLGEIGAGTFAYAVNEPDLVDVLEAEGQTSFIPLATNLRVEVIAAPGYRIGRIYGVPRAKADLTRAYMSSPALYLGQRSGAMDVHNGRRGGGGGLFVELIADPIRGADIGRAYPAFELQATWRNTRTGQDESMARVVINPLKPGENPPSTWPFFSDASRSKAFMMLNMYTAIRAAVDFYDAGDCKRAMGLADMMGPMISEYQRREGSDPDITADAQLLLQVRANVAKACTGRPPVEPRDIHAGCFFM